MRYFFVIGAFVELFTVMICMYVCVSADHPLLAARRLNYEGRSSAGSAECI